MRALLILAALAFSSGAALAQTGATSLPPTGPKPQLAVPYAGPTPCLPVLVVRPTDTDALGWVQPPQNVAWIGTPLQWGVSKNGAWMRYHCAERGTGRVVTVTRVSTLADLPNVSGRIATILKAADPLASLQTVPQRVKVLPLSDSSLAAIVAEVK